MSNKYAQLVVHLSNNALKNTHLAFSTTRQAHSCKAQKVITKITPHINSSTKYVSPYIYYLPISISISKAQNPYQQIHAVTIQCLLFSLNLIAMHDCGGNFTSACPTANLHRGAIPSVSSTFAKSVRSFGGWRDWVEAPLVSCRSRSMVLKELNFATSSFLCFWMIVGLKGIGEVSWGKASLYFHGSFILRLGFLACHLLILSLLTMYF